MFSRTSSLMMLAVLLSAISMTAAADDKPKWEKIAKERGVTVWEKEVPGRDLPVFRGVTVMKERMVDILAVLDDPEGATEWVHNCTANRLIKRTNGLDRILYTLTDAPWPVADRDVVVDARVKLNTKRKEVTIAFKSVDGKKYNLNEVADVVRMPKLKGYYKLRILDENRTRVEYVVDADPGGSLPAWLVTQASRDLPLETLVELRKQVKKTKGRYDAFVKKWDPNKGGELPEEFKQ
ncbi:MAG: START domain-containing protein [Myxococcota bacterium]